MKILLAVDGSEYSKKAVEYLTSKSGLVKNDAAIHLLNVRLPVPNNQGRAVALANQEQIDQYQKEEAAAVLNPIEESLKKNGYNVSSSYVVGEVAQEISNFAREKKADLIVMGSHGRGALQNVVLGSVATKVLALTALPALIVR